MIGVREAEALIARHTLSLSSEFISVESATGRIVAEEIYAPLEVPHFDNSAVDGFALNSAALAKGNRLRCGELLRAQGQSEAVLAHDTTAKIMTGAPMPFGADAVAMIEDVTILGDEVMFRVPVRPQDNIRFRGEDLAKGHLIAQAGDKVTPQLIALCTGLGLVTMPVFRTPRIRIVSTGDELVMPGQSLRYGEVYYLMGAMLKAQCAELGVHTVSYEIVSDDEEAITHALENALTDDVVLITGGMSKGDYDFARRALSRNGCKEIFYQGAWRPGKPLYFGKKNQSLVFGLPGNPVAAFVCFHIFVRAAILRAMKAEKLCRPKLGIAANDFAKKQGFTFFARAVIDHENKLHFLAGQGSHQIHSLRLANALCRLPDDQALVKAGEMIPYYPLL